MEDNANKVTDNFSIRTHPIEVLFDCGATHSFISATPVEMLKLVFNV